jgi:TonB family protein
LETLEPPKAALSETDEEIHLLLERDRRDDWRRWKSAAIVSAGFHIVLLIALLLWPEGDTRFYEERMQPPLQITHLYTPTDITQKAPNKGKLSKELTIEAIAPHPQVKAPNPVPAPKQTPAPAPPPPVARVEPKPVFVEPPKIESPKTQLESQSDQIAKLNAPPPIAPPPEQPKIVFENAAPPPPPPGARPGGAIALPNTSVAGAIHDLATSGGTVSGHQEVGDIGVDLGPAGAGLNLPASPGRSQSNLELRSDPMGVDFRPYLIQVLAAVRRNWFAVYPEAAKTGLRGQAVLEFGIAKGGLVTKVIYSSQTGSRPLDEAAVAAISASNPLPPLPKEFKGDRIVLRMTFKYNMQR